MATANLVGHKPITGGDLMKEARSVSSPAIAEFKREDAAKLAELLNSFDSEGLWPGGFTGGVPYTAERVLDSFPVGVNYISVLISTDKGKFTGICSLHPHWEDPEAAYIGLLGVHPKYLGKGHGKALILKSLQIAGHHNLRRVDLDTWAGNMRAVPLYKKCGLYWIPDTSVEMQDYIPGILDFPMTRDFFKDHHWYSSQVRRLELTPDKFKLGKMEVFPYEFSRGKNHLKVWIDRFGRSILGIERTLRNDHLKILAKLNDHKVIAGIEQKLTIEIINGTKSSVDGALSLSGFDGLRFTACPEQSFTVKRGASLKMEAKFIVDPETEVPEVHRKQKTIKANLIINGELIPLEVGMRILPLLKIRSHPESIAISPGASGAVQYNAFNNSRKRFSGHVFLIDESDSLSLSRASIPLEISSKSHSGFEVAMKVAEDQPTAALPLTLFAKGTVGKSIVETRRAKTCVKCIRPGQVVVSVEDTKFGKSVFVENEDMLASVRLRRGLLDIVCKNTLGQRERVLRGGRIDVGPPFGFVKLINFDYKVSRTAEGLELVLSGMHPDKPGLKMVRALTFFAGTSIIRERVSVVNMAPEKTYKVNVRIPSPWWTPRKNYRVVVPLERVVEHEMVGFPVSESDLPNDPARYKESWICFENRAQDFSFGRVWSNRKLKKIKVDDRPHLSPEYELGEIEPGKSACTSEYYYILERGTWQTIRRRWQQLIEKRIPADDEPVDATPLFSVELAENILYGDSQMKTQLKVQNLRNKRLTGEIQLSAQRSWKIDPPRVEVKDVTAERPFTTEVSIRPDPKASLGICSGKARFLTENQEIDLPLDLCVLSRKTRPPVRMRSIMEEGINAIKTSNGQLVLKSSAKYAGCLYWLGGDKTNHLATAFPEIGTKVFLENYTGGVRTLYLDEDWDFQKSKTHEEAFTESRVKEGRWRGPEFSFVSKRQEELRGLIASISYLTPPHSNVVMIKRRFTNPTKAIFSFPSCLWLSPNVGGNFKENEAVFPRGDQVFDFKRAKGFAISLVEPSEGWILVANKKENLGLGLVAGNTNKSTILSLDLGESMLELLLISRVNLRPGRSVELLDFLALTTGDHRPMEKLANALRRLQKPAFP